MKKENPEKFSNLIKKLEEISLPEIELLGHKRKLKEKLLSQYYKEKKKQELFGIFKKLVPIGAAAILFVIIIFTKLTPPVYTSARAKEIALENPQVKQMINEGAVIADIKIVDSKGYVLLQPFQEKEKQAFEPIKKEEVKKEKIIGALAEIDLKKRKVSKFEKLPPRVLPLPKKEKVKKIFEKNPEIQKILPKEAEIKEIIPLSTPGLKLIKEKDSIRVVPKQLKKAKVIYQFNKNQWEGEVDLIEERIEGLRFLGEIEK